MNITENGFYFDLVFLAVVLVVVGAPLALHYWTHRRSKLTRRQSIIEVVRNARS